jgi:hypothetical protein
MRAFCNAAGTRTRGGEAKGAPAEEDRPYLMSAIKDSTLCDVTVAKQERFAGGNLHA